MGILAIPGDLRGCENLDSARPRAPGGSIKFRDLRDVKFSLVRSTAFTRGAAIPVLIARAWLNFPWQATWKSFSETLSRKFNFNSIQNRHAPTVDQWKDRSCFDYRRARTLLRLVALIDDKMVLHRMCICDYRRTLSARKYMDHFYGIYYYYYYYYCYCYLQYLPLNSFTNTLYDLSINQPFLYLFYKKLK